MICTQLKYWKISATRMAEKTPKVMKTQTIISYLFDAHNNGLYKWAKSGIRNQ